MNSSTIGLIVFATLGLIALISIGIVPEDSQNHPDEETRSVAAEKTTTAAPKFRYIAPGDLAVEMDEFGRAKPSVIGENIIARNRPWKSETVIVKLPVDGEIEYKAIMAQGDSIAFDWTTDKGRVYSDHHGHDNAFGDDFFVRYEESEGTKQAGMIVAPFTGEHGWYWQNLENEPITITLRIAGFFDEIIKIEIGDYQ